MGFGEGKIVERFDCYEGTSAKAKLSKDLYVQGVNFFALKPLTLKTDPLDKTSLLNEDATSG